MAASLRDGLLAAVIPVVIIGGIRVGVLTPTEAAVLAVAYALFLGFVVYRTLAPAKVVDAATATVRLASLSLFSLVGASVFGYLLSFYQVPPALMSGRAISDPTLLLLVMAAVMLLVGTFMDSLPSMAIPAPLFLPVAAAAGVHPVHFGIVGVTALGFGLITPPYGLCSMIASKIGGIPLPRAMGPTLIYLAGLLCVLGAVIVFRELALGLPRLVAPDLIGAA